MVCGPLPSNATVTCNWNMTVRALGDGSYDVAPADVNLDGLCDFVFLPAARVPPSAGAPAPVASEAAYVVYGTAGATPAAEPVPLAPDALAGAGDCSY